MSFRHRIIYKTATMSVLIACGFVASSCVSDTLGSSTTQPQNASLQSTSTEEPRYDPIQRAQAIAEIRAKAANADSGILTNAYAAADGPNEPLTPDDTAAKILELQLIAEEANRNAPVTDEAVMAAKKRRMEALRRRAQSHYGQAINTIEN